MSMTITRRRDSRTKRILMHRIADVRGGVSLKASELLEQGIDYLQEGMLISAPDSEGFCHAANIESQEKLSESVNALYDSENERIVIKNHDLAQRIKEGDMVKINAEAHSGLYVYAGKTIDANTGKDDEIFFNDAIKRNQLPAEPEQQETQPPAEPEQPESPVAGDNYEEIGVQSIYFIHNPTPFAVVGTGKRVVAGQNIDTDAWIIGVTKGLKSIMGYTDEDIAQLKGITNYE